MIFIITTTIIGSVIMIMAVTLVGNYPSDSLNYTKVGRKSVRTIIQQTLRTVRKVPTERCTRHLVQPCLNCMRMTSKTAKGTLFEDSQHIVYGLRLTSFKIQTGILQSSLHTRRLQCGKFSMWAWNKICGQNR